VDQGRGLQQVAGALAAQFPGGDAMELIVDQGSRLLAGVAIAAMHALQQNGKVWLLIFIGLFGRPGHFASVYKRVTSQRTDTSFRQEAGGGAGARDFLSCGRKERFRHCISPDVNNC